jgi:hypothetical protein
MAAIIKQQKEPVLEYLDYDLGSMEISYNKEILLGTYIDKWIFPGKIYLIPTGIRFWYPDNTVGLTIAPIWANKLQVIPQIHGDEQEIWLKVKNPGILPNKIYAGEKIANLMVIPKMECHIVSKGWS